MTTLDIRSIVFAMPHRGPENPLPPLRLLGDLHDDVDGTGLDEEMARNIRYGHVSSVLPYLLQDDYSRELVPRETTVAILENSYLRAMVLLEFRGRLWSLQDKVAGRELLYNNPAGRRSVRRLVRGPTAGRWLDGRGEGPSALEVGDQVGASVR
jgi:hypothetical protein